MIECSGCGSLGAVRKGACLQTKDSKATRLVVIRDYSRPLAALAALLLVVTFFTCDIQRRKSDAELGLNPQQIAGRKIYDSNCDRCHEAYSTKGKKGPGLKGTFQNKYLSVSGLPANDERVTDIIRLGRKEMPGYNQKLSPQDIEDLLAYLHTL
jgi:mono/diheme cytochrome c family protein